MVRGVRARLCARGEVLQRDPLGGRSGFPRSHRRESRALRVVVRGPRLNELESVRLVLTVRDFALYIQRYWRYVGEQKASQLQSPRQFRRKCRRYPIGGDVASACTMLLLAEEAAGQSLPADIRKPISQRGVVPPGNHNLIPGSRYVRTGSASLPAIGEGRSTQSLRREPLPYGVNTPNSGVPRPIDEAGATGRCSTQRSNEESLLESSPGS